MVGRAVRVMAAVVGLVALSVLVQAAPAAAHDPRPSLQCGVTPTTDVVLREDLVCTTPFTFFPDGQQLDVDLNGHTLELAGGCPTTGVLCSVINSAGSVHDGRVIGGMTDIGTIDGVHVQGNVEMGAFWWGGRHLSITRSSVEGFVRLWRPDLVVDRNIIRGSVILNDTEMGVRNTTVTRNWILGGGISMVPIPIDDPWELSGDISRNLIIGAPGAGIEIGSVLRNIGPTTIVGNIVMRSAGDGIAIGRNPWSHPGAPHPAATVLVQSNLTVGNGGHGIYNGVPPDSPELTVVDGGGNRAAANLGRPQCVGIDCNRRW